MEKLSPPVKTIFFDIGNVLVFFSHETMFSQIASCANLPLSVIKDLFLNQHMQENVEKGKLSPEALYHLLLQKAPSPFPLEAFLQAASQIFRPNTPVLALVQRLKQEGKRLIFLSNTNAYHFHYLFSSIPEFHLFDDRILSHEVRAMKPEPAIFAKALALANCPPEECFYIDDIPEFVASARQVGLNGEVYKNPETLERHLRERGCFSIPPPL